MRHIKNHFYGLLCFLTVLHSASALAAIPNDPSFLKQWALNFDQNLAAGNNWDIGDINADSPQQGNTSVVVAILDSGVDFTHEDLKPVMWVNQAELNGKDNVDDDNNGCVDDIYGCDLRAGVKEKIGFYPGLGGAYYRQQKYMYADGIGHGSMVAGIVGARANNGVGIAGISWNVKIMPVKVIYPYNVAEMTDVARGIHYAVDNGARIINISFGRNRISDEEIQVLNQAIEYAQAANVLIVAAAGNSGMRLDEQHNFYPAGLRHDNLISVTAVDQSGQLWAAANRGAAVVDVAAPGVAIYSTVPVGNVTLFRKYYDQSGYQLCEGTSVATPFVTGIAALIFSHYPNYDYHKVKKIILESVDIEPALADDIRSSGKVNLFKAMKMALSQ